MLHTLSHPISPSQPTIALLNLPLRSPDSQHTLLLVFAQPYLHRFAEDSLPQEIHKLPSDDEHKRDRVQEMDGIAKNPQTNDHSPEIAGQETDVEERGGSKPIYYRHQRIEQTQNECIAGQVAANLPIPHRIPEPITVEDTGLDPIDNRPPPTNLPNNLIKRPLAHQELLRYIGQAIERRACQSKEITLQLVT